MTLWQPVSTCGAGCIQAPASPVSPLRRAARLIGVTAVLLAGAAALPAIPLLPPARRATLFRRLARGVLRSLGVRLTTRGRLPRGGALLVANHISWLDVIALLAAAPPAGGPIRLLAKREVRGWPLIGALAAAIGTVFLDRTRPRTLPTTVAAVAAALRDGAVVALFPEGTTWCGAPSGGPFRPAMFQAALDAGATVVPVCIRYTGTDPDGAETTSTVPAFIGADTLWASLRRILAAPTLTVSLAASPALHPDAAATRRALARIAESTVHTDTAPALPAAFAAPAVLALPALTPTSAPPPSTLRVA